MNGKVGTNLVLSCDLETNYKFRIIWERNGAQITEKNDFEGINVVRVYIYISYALLALTH